MLTQIHTGSVTFLMATELLAEPLQRDGFTGDVKSDVPKG